MDPKKSNEKGMERSASSGHGVPVDCQSNFSSSYACPRPQPVMDSFASSDMAALSDGSSFLAPTPAPGLLPQAGLARFPAGFGFFDRSAWSSCIGGGGAMNVNAFNAAEHMNSSGGNAEPELGRSGHEEWPSSERSDSKRRRPNGEATGTEQVQSSSLPADSADESAHSKGRGEESSPATTAGMPKRKGAKGGSERRKEEYIHVRTRRGQATNSHSLAERLRREKISERMKLLQDLVPGCSKVTGKAVMLDEIINYVQSLQRQVEFLSMKLATVNPRLDVSIEGLLSKDLLRFPGVRSSSSIRFSQELMHPQLQLSQPALLQGSVPAMASPDVIRRVMQAQQPGSQMAHILDGSFHGVAQIRDGFLM